jgi:hypothetical protein
LAPIPSRINPTTILIYSTSYEPLRFRDIENRTSKSSDMNYSSPTIGVRFTFGAGRGCFFGRLGSQPKMFAVLREVIQHSESFPPEMEIRPQF